MNKVDTYQGYFNLNFRLPTYCYLKKHWSGKKGSRWKEEKYIKDENGNFCPSNNVTLSYSVLLICYAQGRI